MKHKKDSKKSKQKKSKSKEKHQKHGKSRRRSSSTSSNSSEDQETVWVEKAQVEHNTGETKQNPTASMKEKAEVKREDWLGLNSLFPCTFNSQDEKKIRQKHKAEQDRCILDQPGQSSKELNPYWKDGGNGLPQMDSMKLNTDRFLDPIWLRKSLQRAQEQADKEGKSLAEVAAERWGSLEAIESMIADAENAKRTKQNISSRTFKKYRENNDEYRSRSYQQKFRKPDGRDYDSNFSYRTKYSTSKNWQKKSMDNQHCDRSKLNATEAKDNTLSVKNIEDTHSNSVHTIPMTEAELNKLGAKIVKAEIMGDTELATKLKAELEVARGLVKKGSDLDHSSKQDVILVKTDSRGITRPLERGSNSRETSYSKKKRVETHVSGERVRHYFDDDKYSLHQLFQREKGRSVDEDDAVFTKKMSRNMDMDDLFEERITQAPSAAKQESKERAAAVNEHQRLTKSLDNCHWCVNSQYMLKHMIVAMNCKICLSLPAYVSLTEGHCILTPVHHIPCQLQLDEDIWDELKNYKQALCKMFAEQDQYPVFFEIYKNRHKFPHMQVECIPLPKEIGESAPLYFKKALLECETEWSVNKKVIDLKQKDLRSAVPKGLPYFVVQFGFESGYAHVIEEERLFPKNFAEEIIGGMLDLDHDLWRKPRKEKFEQQREKVLRFTETWKKYDSGIENIKS